MRGCDTQQAGLFSYLSPEARVPVTQPLRPIQQSGDMALSVLSAKLTKLYAHTGRPSEQILWSDLAMCINTNNMVSRLVAPRACSSFDRIQDPGARCGITFVALALTPDHEGAAPFHKYSHHPTT